MRWLDYRPNQRRFQLLAPGGGQKAARAEQHGESIAHNERWFLAVEVGQKVINGSINLRVTGGFDGVWHTGWGRRRGRSRGIGGGCWGSGNWETFRHRAWTVGMEGLMAEVLKALDNVPEGVFDFAAQRDRGCQKTVRVKLIG